MGYGGITYLQIRANGEKAPENADEAMEQFKKVKDAINYPISITRPFIFITGEAAERAKENQGEIIEFAIGDEGFEMITFVMIEENSVGHFKKIASDFGDIEEVSKDLTDVCKEAFVYDSNAWCAQFLDMDDENVIDDFFWWDLGGDADILN